MSFSNTGGVDLESVLNVRRRTLAAIGESAVPRQRNHYTDTIYLKREDSSNSILSIDSKIFISGELQLLCALFERYTSNITVYEESAETVPSSPISSTKPSFSATAEENEGDEDEPPLVSTLRQTSISSASSVPKESTSPPQTSRTSTRSSGSPTRKKTLSSIGRSQTTGSVSSDYSVQNLEGKRYGSIQLPNMTIIEILEILLRTGLEIVHVSSDYDKENVLHQNFVISKTRQASQKYGQTFSRSSSIIGT